VIPYGCHDITDADIEAVVEVLRSDRLTQGPMVPRFEQALAVRCGASHAVAANSGTSALHLACMGLGLGPGDHLWTSPLTFVASANCARYCGAEVDFVDVDPETTNLSVTALADKLVDAEREGKLPSVVVPVHLGGHPCDMPAIHDLGRRYGFAVLEDASHALGATSEGAPVGGCRYSDAAVFSFHPVKLVTTGEGGMLVTCDAGLAERAGLLRSHGITRDPALMNREPDGPWYYQQLELGYNYRMTDIQAALGACQLERLEDYLARRESLAHVYDEVLADLPVDMPWRPARDRSAWHLYVVRLRRSECPRTRRAVFEQLREAGIGVNLHYIPVHLQPYYRNLGFREGDFPEAERYYEEAITLPLHPRLTQEDQRTVVAALRRALS